MVNPNPGTTLHELPHPFIRAANAQTHALVLDTLLFQFAPLAFQASRTPTGTFCDKRIPNT